MELRMDGRKALVTGASLGLGKAMAERFAGAGAEVAINWRVDRMRPTAVVFIREDNAHPDIPPTTRVMPLYPVGAGS